MIGLETVNEDSLEMRGLEMRGLETPIAVRIHWK
jgi:hypothetical protein